MITVSVAGQTSGKDVRIPRSKDLEVQWEREGEPSGVVKLILTQKDDSSHIACTYPVEGGSGKVPASALSAFPAGNGGLYFELVEEKNLGIAEGWKVRVALSAKPAGLGPDGIAGGNVILE
ncbi:hypothetical protein LZC95_49590 [Pendulispora brunnea]|uniref:Uncharacterized protein n=1 Tax=Pendulispora brunnea TaxID=2905690 RepID=A0ABZ2K728_9BACT